MMTSRYETPFQITLDAEQVRFLASNQEPGRQQLAVSVAGDSLRAGWPANDTFDHPPVYIAHVERNTDGLHVDGVVRESWSNMMWARIWVAPTVLMSAVLVLGVVVLATSGVHDARGPLLVGVIATPLFALMWRWQLRERRPSFDRDTKKLTAGVTRYLTTGDGSRPIR